MLLKLLPKLLPGLLLLAAYAAFSAFSFSLTGSIQGSTMFRKA